MSGSGDAWDPKRPDGSYYNPFPDSMNGAGTSSGVDLLPNSQVGLFGGGYVAWLKNQAANGTLPSPADFGAPTGFSIDDTGLPPSVTLTAGLPLNTDPFASLQQVLNFTDDNLGLSSLAGAHAQPPGAMSNWQAPSAPDVSSMPDLWQIDGRQSTSATGNAGAPVVQYDLPGVGMTYLDPEFANRLDDFRQRAQARGVSLGFASGYRDQQEQDDLHHDPTATAPAKLSLHSTGNAVDVSRKIWNDLSPEARSKLVEDARGAGLSWGGLFKGEGYDPRHFYYDPGGNRARQIMDFSQGVQAFENRRMP